MGSLRKFVAIAGMLLFSVAACVPAHAGDSGGKEKPCALKIVIDAGHGGRDPGAVSPSGVMEKTITLSLAGKLARKLRERGFEVIMTREDDTFLTLRERTRLANRARADLFISVHVNANDDKSYEGVETYFLSLSADASSTRVAQRENDAGPEVSGDLQLIIQDIAVNGKINESSLFASSVQRGVVSSLRGRDSRYRDSGVRQAYFHVLVGALMPSILVETGFITNPAEAKLLQDKDYQDRLTDGIVDGIDLYSMEKINTTRTLTPRQTRPDRHASG